MPVVQTSEVKGALAQLEEPYPRMIRLAYGAGLRKMNILRLRVNDVDF